MVEPSTDEAEAAYDCIKAELAAGYAKSEDTFVANYQIAESFNTALYQSSTHGNRFVNNFANAEAYGKFEDSSTLPKETMFAKDSFIVSPAGALSGGPLFPMEKMGAGFNDGTGD